MDPTSILWIVLVIAIVVWLLGPPYGDDPEEQNGSTARDESVYVPTTEYTVTDKERIAAELFIEGHPCAIAEPLYKFSREGGIGIGVTACCSSCGETRDVTDYSTW